MIDDVRGHADRFRVEPILAVLNEHDIGIAPSTFYAHAARGFGPTEPELADAYAANQLHGFWVCNRRLYGRRKLWKTARRAGIDIGRDHVERLFRTEVIEHERPVWNSWRQVEQATASWVHWYNHERLHSSIGDITLVEFEELNYALPQRPRRTRRGLTPPPSNPRPIQIHRSSDGPAFGDLCIQPFSRTFLVSWFSSRPEPIMLTPCPSHLSGGNSG